MTIANVLRCAVAVSDPQDTVDRLIEDDSASPDADRR
jgi:hypothetical protein